MGCKLAKIVQYAPYALMYKIKYYNAFTIQMHITLLLSFF